MGVRNIETPTLKWWGKIGHSSLINHNVLGFFTHQRPFVIFLSSPLTLLFYLANVRLFSTQKLILHVIIDILQRFYYTAIFPLFVCHAFYMMLLLLTVNLLVSRYHSTQTVPTAWTYLRNKIAPNNIKEDKKTPEKAVFRWKKQRERRILCRTFSLPKWTILHM